MPVIDRMEFPRKFKLKQSLVLFVLLAIGFGIWLNNHNQKRILDSIIISDARVDSYSGAHVEISYEVENKLKKDMELRILAVVYDLDGAELASAMYMGSFPASTKRRYTKNLTDLARGLAETEIPGKVVVKVYPRRVL